MRHKKIEDDMRREYEQKLRREQQDEMRRKKIEDDMRRECEPKLRREQQGEMRRKKTEDDVPAALASSPRRLTVCELHPLAFNKRPLKKLVFRPRGTASPAFLLMMMMN